MTFRDLSPRPSKRFSGGATKKQNNTNLALAMSRTLDTGLNDPALTAIQDLLRAGVAPDAVVAVVLSLHQHTAAAAQAHNHRHQRR